MPVSPPLLSPFLWPAPGWWNIGTTPRHSMHLQLFVYLVAVIVCIPSSQLRAPQLSRHTFTRGTGWVVRVLSFLRGDFLQIEIFMLFLFFKIENTCFLPQDDCSQLAGISSRLLRWTSAWKWKVRLSVGSKPNETCSGNFRELVDECSKFLDFLMLIYLRSDTT